MYATLWNDIQRRLYVHIFILMMMHAAEIVNTKSIKGGKELCQSEDWGRRMRAVFGWDG